VWSDEFSTEAPMVRIERISRSVVGMTGTAPRDIDFRIKMPDQAGRGLLWEDKIEPVDESQTPATEQSDDMAGRLRRDRAPMNPSSALPASVPSSGIEIDRKTATIAPGLLSAGFAFS
jgi:hypothetical protein